MKCHSRMLENDEEGQVRWKWNEDRETTDLASLAE